MHPRRLIGASGRPLNFAVRWQLGASRTFHLWYSCSGGDGGELAYHDWSLWNRARRRRLREKLRGEGASRWDDGVLGDAP
jgi:hypothetical protein